MLPIKLYLCLIISNMSVASSNDNKTFDLIYNHLSIAMVENFYKSKNINIYNIIYIFILFS